MALSVDNDGMCDERATGAASERRYQVRRSLAQTARWPFRLRANHDGLRIRKPRISLFFIRYVIYHAASTTIFQTREMVRRGIFAGRSGRCPQPAISALAMNSQLVVFGI